MSLTLTLMNSLSGLQTNQNALQVTSNNIANLNTPEYTRKVHEQATRLLGSEGAGVETAQIIRKVDEFLRKDLIRETSDIGNAELRAEFYDRMQQLFGSVGNNNALGNTITDMAVALENVANNPEVAAHRFTAMGEAGNVARQIQELASEAQNLRGDADRRISIAMDLLNTKLEAITDLNREIVRNLPLDRPVGDLKDQVDAALAVLSEHLEIQHFTDPTGMTSVMTKDGSKLVAGTVHATLSYTTSSTMSANQTYPGTISGILLDGTDITGQITGGKLGGLIEMRDQLLPAMTNQLDQLSAGMRDTLNRIQNRGANTPFGNGQAAADDAAMYGSRIITAPGDPLTLSHDVTLQILDTNGDPAIAPATLAAGATTPAAIAAAIDGYLDSGIDYGEAAFVGNRLEIKLEQGYRLAFLDNGPATDDGDVTVTFDADGDATPETYKGFGNFFGLNDLFETPELTSTDLVMENQGSQLGISSSIRVRQQIVDNPDYLARGTLRGTPPSYHLGIGDNEIAQQMADAFDTNLVYGAVANGPPQTTTTFSGYAGTILSFNAAGAEDAENTLKFQTFFFEDLENRVRSQSGVNLDEELSNMVLFQNAYTASARVMQTANELLDVLINLT